MSLILRVLHTLIDLVIIASFTAISVGTFWLIKELRSLIEPRRIRILKGFAKAEAFSIERLAMGMWDALHWSVTFKRGYSFLGKPENKIRPQFGLFEFPESLRAGTIAFPKSSKEIISLRFHNSFPDDFYDCAFFVIDSLIKTINMNQKKRETFLVYGSAQAMSFGLLLKRDWKDSLTKQVFDEDCFCLDIVGISSEFLFLLTAKLLEVFGQQAALVRAEGWGREWVVRRISNQGSKGQK